MENSSVLDNNNGSSFNTEKQKGRLNKKIVIICSLITILIIAVIVFFIISTQSSRIIENYINAQLSETDAKYGDNFNYNPVKCSGIKDITCSTDFIEFIDAGQKFTSKNITFTASPSLTQLIAGVTGNVDISAANAEADNVIKFDFNCTDNITLLNERSLLAHNLVCNSNMNNIHSSQNSVFYMKDDVYGQNSSMIGVLKAFAEKEIDLATQLVNYTVIESSSSKIESPALMDDIVAIMQSLAKSYGDENITKEGLVSIYASLKNDYIKFKEYYGNNKYTNFMDNLINILDGVIYNNNNTISMSMTIKDKDSIDEIFGSEYIKFMLPDIYDIEITSSK